MCGIIGVVGAEDALGILLEGLERLEYRGYDSAGVAIQEATARCGGAGQPTARAPSPRSPSAARRPRRGPTTGIGHTRWATHGAPIESNAHPQVDCAGSIAVIHNGIIENHAAARRAAARRRAHLHERHGHRGAGPPHRGRIARAGLDLPDAVAAALREVTGDFSIAVLDAATPGQIVAARRVSPLIVGRGDGVTYLASDIPAILEHTRDLVAVEDDQLAVLTAAGLVLHDLDGASVDPTELCVEWDVESAQLGGHPDFMTKEIFEQPEAVRATLRGAARPGGRDRPRRAAADRRRSWPRSTASCSSRCGSSYHAALVGQPRDRGMGAARLRRRDRERVPLPRRGARRADAGRRGLAVRRDDRHAPGAARGAQGRGADRRGLQRRRRLDGARGRRGALHARRPRDRCRRHQDGPRPDRRARAARAAPRPGARRR